MTDKNKITKERIPIPGNNQTVIITMYLGFAEKCVGGLD